MIALALAAALTGADGTCHSTIPLAVCCVRDQCGPVAMTFTPNVEDERVDALTNRKTPFVVYTLATPDCPEIEGVKHFSFIAKVNGKIIAARCPDDPSVQLLAGTPADELAELLDTAVQHDWKYGAPIMHCKSMRTPTDCIDREIDLRVYKEDQ